MGARTRSQRESVFGDALAGAGGMADPSYASSLSARVYPDALSAVALGGLPLPAGNVPAVGVTRSVPPVVAPARPANVPRSRQAPVRPAQARPVPGQRPWSQYPPPGLPVAARPGPPRPLPVGRAPGQPAQQYVPVPTSAQLAPGLPGRPPAYLPARPGLAQVRSAVAQARTTSASASAAGRQLRAARAARAAKKNSGGWGFLGVVIVLLVTTGAGQKIISLISDLLQRR